MESKRYSEERYRQMFNSSVCGLVLSVGVNAGIVFGCSFSGLKYLYPPPQEKTVVIDFEEIEEPEILPQKEGREPQAEEVNPAQKVELVQKSQAQTQGTKQNLADEATVGKDGDAAVPEPPREKPIDQRALFHSAKNTEKDTVAPQTSREVSDALKAGHASGNTPSGPTEGMPNARVKGRNVVGVPVKPSYDVQNSGIVEVEIWVDNQGEVTKAIAGGGATTVTDKTLWNAARQAALKTRFNVDPEAPGLQKGTITYIFNLE